MSVSFCDWKNKSLKVDALSGRTVFEEKISVAYEQEEIVQERIELELVEAKVEEAFEEEEFHEVKEYFQEEEFHDVEEFIRVEERRFQEEHKVEEVHRVIEFLEAEEVEVYEKPKIPPKKGIGDSADNTVCYIFLLPTLFSKYLACSVQNVSPMNCFRHECKLFNSETDKV